MADTPGCEYQEGALVFRFDPQWRVIKYDATDEWARSSSNLDPRHRDDTTHIWARCNILAQIQKTKAVDFIAQHDRHGVVFLEVKDYRRFSKRLAELAPESKNVAGDGKDLLEEVAVKVRDSIAGVVGACRTAAPQAEWESVVSSLRTRQSRCLVVLWLEEDDQGKPARDKRQGPRRNTRKNRLKKKLAWLTPDVIITNTRLQSLKENGIVARYACPDDSGPS